MLNTKKIISESALFSGLDKEDVEKLEEIAHLKTYERNEIVFSEGLPAKGLFLIAEGQVKIYKISSEGREHILHNFGPGDIFAEAAVFAGTTYPAFAETLTDSNLIFISRAELLDLIKKNPDLSMKMLATLSGRLRGFVNTIEDLSLKDVSARLAQYILDLSVQNNSGKSFILDINKAELARRIGTVPETLSRTLKKLKQNKVLTIEKKQVHILNEKCLTHISDGLKL